MKTVDMVVKAPHFYTMEGEGVGYKTGVVMIVDKGKILGFADENQWDKEYKPEGFINLEHHMVLPGLVNAHMHSAYGVLRGLAQDVNNWMMEGFQPFDNASTQEQKDLGSQLSYIEGVKSGTTTFSDFETHMDGVCEFVKKIGVRANVTQTIRSAKFKSYKPGELYEFDIDMGLKSLERNIELYNNWHNSCDERIKILFGPQAMDFVDVELLQKVQKAVKERNTKIHMHVQQGDRETNQILRRYGKRPTEFLKELGILDKDLIAVHLTDCTDEEVEIIAKSGATMAVNPGAIGLIDGIVCPSTVFQKAGGYVGLGTDSAPGNNCQNIISEMKNISVLNKVKYQSSEIIPAWKALRMGTIEGAKAIGLGDKIGSLEEGKKADFIAVDLDLPTMLPVYTYPMRNMVPNFVYSARGEEVVLSVVDGKIIMKDQKILTVDERETIEAIKKCPDELGKAASAEFFEINGASARFMREDKL